MLRLSPGYWAWQRIIVTQPTLPDSMETLLDPKLVAFPRFMTKFDLLWRNACGSAQLIPVSGQYQWWRPSYCFSRWAALSSPQSPASVGHWLSRWNILKKKSLKFKNQQQNWRFGAENSWENDSFFSPIFQFSSSFFPELFPMSTLLSSYSLLRETGKV